MNLTKEQVQCAVAWWVGSLKSPKFDNGEKETSRRVTEMVEGDPVSEISLKAFEVALLLGLSTVDADYTMHNDYDPQDEVLETAAAFSGISHRLPWKTRMKFEDGGVQVKCGYGAGYIELLKKPI